MLKITNIEQATESLMKKGYTAEQIDIFTAGWNARSSGIGDRVNELASNLNQIHQAGYADRLGFDLKHNTSWVKTVEIVNDLLEGSPDSAVEELNGECAHYEFALLQIRDDKLADPTIRAIAKAALDFTANKEEKAAA